VALYLIKRLVLTIPVLFATALMIFFLFQMIPGDVVQASMTQKLMTAEQQDAIREALGLNKPVLERAADYAIALMQGDLGRSFRTGQPVLDMLLSQLPYTVILIAWSLLLAVLIGIPLGLAAALRRNSSVDAASMTAAVLGASIPQYWLGLVLILVFAVNLRWLPATGSAGFDTLILPAITLGVGNAAIIARLTRSQMVEVLQSDYVRTAEAKGVGRSRVVLRHAFRNSLIPIITMLGLQVGALLGGAVVVEVVFARPGLGTIVVQSILKRDIPVVQGGIVLIAALFVLVNLAVDVSYSFLDPRIRTGRSSSGG
jgi:peptide/nickel transport system permease protein